MRPIFPGRAGNIRYSRFLFRTVHKTVVLLVILTFFYTPFDALIRYAPNPFQESLEEIVQYLPEIQEARAAALAGDYLIMRNNAATDAVTNTGNLDAAWDTQVTSKGSSITYSAGTFTLATGKYLVMYSERFESADVNNNQRNEIQSRLVVSGGAVTTAAGQAYMRKQDGSAGDWQDDAIVHGAGVLDIASDGTSLVTRFYRTDSASDAGGTTTRFPGWGGVTILALDGTWNYARYNTTANKAATTSEVTWADFIWDTNVEQDAGFSRTSGDITITSAGRYIVTVSVPIQGGSDRSEYNMRLTLNNTEIEGTDVSTYLRNNESTNDGVLTYVGIINVAASDVLAVEHIMREGAGTFNYLSGSSVEIVQLPAGNETIIVEATTGEMNPSTLTEFVWDTTAYIDTAGFTMAAGTDSFFKVDVSDDYLLFATHKTNNAGTRTYATGRFSINDVILNYGAGGEYGRSTGTADHPGYSFGMLATGLSANDDISLENIYIEDTRAAQTVNHGAMSALRWGSVFSSASPVTSQLHFRWRDDTTALNSSGGWLAVEDSNVIGDAVKETTYRLRMETANTGAGIEAAARTYEIQFGLKSTTCGAISSWTGVADSTDAFEMVNTASISPDGQATTALLANTETYTFTAGEGRDTADTTGSIGPLAVDYYTELEYSLRPTDLAVTGDSYCFRLYDTTAGAILNAYSVYPEVTMSSTSVSYTNTIMEWGTQASVDDDAWITVNFAGNYVDPIFVCSSEYNANIGNESDATADSVVCRVQNVGATSAQVRLQEPGTLVGSVGNLTAETIHWMVVEAGAYDNADIKMEAFKYNSTVTDGKTPVGWTGQSQTLTQSYTSPVVLGQVMTTNDTAHSQFWAHNGSNGAPTGVSFYAGKHISEDNTTTRSDETVGVIVIEQANNTVNSIVYESRLQTQTIDRIDDAPPSTYTFNTAFSTTPSVAIVSLAGVSGTDGPYPSLYGTSILSTTTIDLVVMETEIVDTEQTGNTEFVPYIVFESVGTYSLSSNIALDQDTFRFYQNTDAIQPSVALGNENSAITNVADATVLRIRTAIQAGGLLEANALAFKLQYGQGATCSAIGSWVDVGAIGSGTIWRGYNNATPADGASITASLLNAMTNALESYEEANNTVSNPVQIADGAHGEWDWVVQNNSATAGTDYCFRVTKSDGSVMEYTTYPKATTAGAPSTLTQSAYRFFRNENSTSVGGQPLSEQDTPAYLMNPDDPSFRLRMIISVDSNNLSQSGDNFKLQYAGKGGGTCSSPSGTPSSYTDVTAGTSISYNDNLTPTDGAALTAYPGFDPIIGGRARVDQTYEELNNFTNSVAAINIGQDGMWDFALKDLSAPESTTYCIRAVKSDSSALNSYTQYPEFTTIGGAPATIVPPTGIGNPSIGGGSGGGTVIHAGTLVGAGGGSEGGESGGGGEQGGGEQGGGGGGSPILLYLFIMMGGMFPYLGFTHRNRNIDTGIIRN